MKNRYLLSWILGGITILLVGCGKQGQEADGRQDHKGLYNQVSVPLEKAKGVDEQIQGAAEEQRKQIDQQAEQ